MNQETIHTGSSRNEAARVTWKQQSLRRIYILLAVFLGVFALVTARLGVIQIFEADTLQKIAADMYQYKEAIRPVRGLIMDRNLSILVSNVNEYTLFADPCVMKNRDSVARILARDFPGDVAYYKSKFKDTTLRYVVLHKHLSEEAAAPLLKKRIYGVRLLKTPRRHYNFDGLASAVLGFTDAKNEGRSGIEQQFNEQLAGKPGFIVYQLDANSRRKPEVDYPRREAVNGRSVVLTIDQAYQSIAEEELRKGVDRSDAISGRCIIMQPRTGEVLALANYPGINPNKLRTYKTSEIIQGKNRVVTDVYEPGSTFKLVPMSAALDAGAAKAEDVMNAEGGSWTYSAGQKPIRDEHGADRLTLRQAFIVSSNIISAKLADKLGAERFYEYARNFGFGIRTGLELPGEVRGELRKPTSWDGTTLKYLAFGYGLSVTAIQIACAYAAIANDGVLMRPYLMRWLLDEDRNIVEENSPQIIRRVVSSAAAAEMRSFMQGVVETGTARNARIEGMDIAGKTGTSQRLVGSTYSHTSHVASFVGFFPARDPRILILVILDEPKNGYYGGVVAAPVFREIALRIMNSRPEFARPPEPEPPSSPEGFLLPDVCGLDPAAAVVVLKSQGFAARMKGEGPFVREQTPEAGRRAGPGREIVLTLASGKRRSEDVKIPNVQGLSLRHAVAKLRAAGLTPSPAGSGVVCVQLPSPGDTVSHGTRCTIIAEPRCVLTANRH